MIELVVGGQELPVEKIGELATVDREQLGPRHDPQLFGDAAVLDAL